MYNNIEDLNDRWQMKFTVDVGGVMNKGEKSSQATYMLMDSYLTAANQQKVL